MRKLLYSTSALVAVGLAAGQAVAAEKVKVGVGGYMQGFFVYADQDGDSPGQPAANLRDHAVKREGELIFGGNTTLDNGIQVGVQVQVEAETCADQIDESFIWFEGGFGRINIGSENSAAYLMHYASPAPSHWAHGLNSANFSHVSAGTTTFPTTQVLRSSDSEKITYFTPRIAGFQFGASYTPDNCEENNANGATRPACGGSYGGLQNETLVGSQSEIIEVGANYTGKFGGIGLNFSVAYGHSEIEGKGGTPAAPLFEDAEEYNAGFRISWAGFTIGGAYKEDDLGIIANNSERTDYNIGIRYASGPWGIGIQHAHVEIEQGAAGGENELDAYEIGGSYTLGPGIVLSAGVQNWDHDTITPAVTDNEGTVVFIGTHVAF